MAVADDLLAKIADLKAQAQAEHEQVATAIADLKTAVTNAVTPDQLAAIDAAFADLAGVIGAVYEPEATPAPEPTP